MDESSTVDEGIGTTELKTIDQTTDQTIDLTDDTDETETCSKASILVRVGNLKKALKCVLNLARMSGYRYENNEKILNGFQIDIQ